MMYIGVDLGGTGIKAGVVNEQGEILSKGSTPTMKERPYQDIIHDIATLCQGCCAAGGHHDGRCCGNRRGCAGHL